MIERDIAREIARLTQTPEDWNKYRQLRNKVTKQQRKDKHDHLNDLYKKVEEENDTANLFGITKKLLGWKMSSPPKSFLLDGRPIRTQKEVENTQAEFYVNKIKRIKDRLPRVRRDPLYYLRKAFLRWVPSGGIVKLKLDKSLRLKS